MSKTPLAIEDYPGYSANEWRGRFASETIEWMEPDQLLAHPDNHRIHIQLQQQQVETLLDVLGWVDVVKVNKRTGCTVDGHLRVILAIRHKTKVPVLWLDLTEAEERAALTSLDYTASKAGIDLNILATNVEFMQVEFPALEVVWENFKLDFELNGNGHEPNDAPPGIDRAAELQEKWKVLPGELFEIGAHRLICGDCTDAAIVARLMGEERADLCFTDPPYGVKRDKGFTGAGGFNGKGEPIPRRQYSDDWDSDRPSKEQFDYMLSCADNSIFWGGNYYADILPQSTHWIVWDKNNTMPTFGDCELAWTSLDRKSVKKYEITYNGLIGKEDKRYHPTQKPLTLFVACLSDYSRDGETIVDFYAGSGTTLVACENLSRRGRGIEISPAYCAVILERMTTAFPALPVTRVSG